MPAEFAISQLLDVTKFILAVMDAMEAKETIKSIEQCQRELAQTVSIATSKIESLQEHDLTCALTALADYETTNDKAHKRELLDKAIEDFRRAEGVEKEDPHRRGLTILGYAYCNYLKGRKDFATERINQFLVQFEAVMGDQRQRNQLQRIGQLESYEALGARAATLRERWSKHPHLPGPRTASPRSQRLRWGILVIVLLCVLGVVLLWNRNQELDKDNAVRNGTEFLVHDLGPKAELTSPATVSRSPEGNWIVTFKYRFPDDGKNRMAPGARHVVMDPTATKLIRFEPVQQVQ